ncbi:serine protease [Marivirga tractuosa]|uniref:HtrA2 peptidase n=1 Tax=Marivirga tractuosa (strain ATCC 23168 / DSM 4126 / NBRC 15989 / NCIMB 1408 / VKM B-1430 / H-43) TaxID=643867 RepID=E4TU43_MARTH|nr:trypsin-like peptidase domain-containing protein [Marivirga tractuosa]ADR23065.1 HtrA2 peptidase [Marivirga tractuosa DSM 4126]BDD16261.1 serine protease [Marivirga tractuosa]
MNQYLKTTLSAFSGAILGALLIFYLTDSKQEMIMEDSAISTPVRNVVFEKREDNSKATGSIPEVDFVEASKNSRESVVYIKTVSEAYGRSSWLDLWLGGGGSMQQVGSGSGVIFRSDGYIITNNHVIEGADDIEVVRKKKTYKASLVGRDPSTDLAVLKIDEKNLPAIAIGSSKDLQVGSWVLAVGNPFNLTSTVTAGIVSAKGRELNILKSNFPIESFIQTDAAINPGNSGGALVNPQGELVGINTAILSRTGSYAGYGFAVPIDIAKKIASDIIEYGMVQKAFLGAEVSSLSPEIADKLETDNLDGVVVSYIQEKGAADKVNLQKGDIIREFNGEDISTHAEFEEKLSMLSPGDKLYLTVERKGKNLQKELILTNSENTTELLKRDVYFSKSLGAEFESVPLVERNLLDIKSGVRVVDVKNGFFKRLNIDEGFIITDINGNQVNSPKELSNILESIKGKVVVRGVNKKGVKGYYSYYF